MSNLLQLHKQLAFYSQEYGSRRRKTVQTILAPVRNHTSDTEGRETVSIKKPLEGVSAVTSMHDADHCTCLGNVAYY